MYSDLFLAPFQSIWKLCRIFNVLLTACQIYFEFIPGLSIRIFLSKQIFLNFSFVLKINLSGETENGSLTSNNDLDRENRACGEILTTDVPTNVETSCENRIEWKKKYEALDKKWELK